jgi:hypothetical protein
LYRQFESLRRPRWIARRTAWISLMLCIWVGRKMRCLRDIRPAVDQGRQSHRLQKCTGALNVDERWNTAAAWSASLETLVEKRIFPFRESAEKPKEDMEALRH